MTNEKLAAMSRAQLMAEVQRLRCLDDLSAGHIRRLQGVQLVNERLGDALRARDDVIDAMVADLEACAALLEELLPPDRQRDVARMRLLAARGRALVAGVEPVRRLRLVAEAAPSP